MDTAGYFINLDRNPERRAGIEAEIARHNLGLNYARFRAVEGNALGFPAGRITAGEMGCFTSHYLLLKENFAQNRHLHIIEDDILFAGCTEQAIRWAVAQGFLSRYDIILTDAFIPLQNDAYIAYKKFYDAAVTRNDDGKISRAAFTVIDMKDIMFASTCSMLINRDSIEKLHDLYEQELTRGSALAIDLFIREKTRRGAIRTGCLFPFVTSIRLDHILTSGIESERKQDLQSSLAVNIARHSFFIDCDWDECRRYLDKYLPLPADTHRAVLGHILAFSMTEETEMDAEDLARYLRA